MRHSPVVRRSASTRSCVEVDHTVEQGECSTLKTDVQVALVPGNLHPGRLSERHRAGHSIVCCVIGVCAIPVSHRSIDGDHIATHRRAGVFSSREVNPLTLHLRLDHHTDVGSRRAHVRHCQVEQVALMNQRRAGHRNLRRQQRVAHAGDDAVRARVNLGVGVGPAHVLD